jgi:hypothetical protein
MTEQSEGWRAGDLAVCNAYGPWFNDGAEPVTGPEHEQVLWVAAVYSDAPIGSGVCLALEFDEFPDEMFPARDFRRIAPDYSSAGGRRIVALIKGAGAGVPA